MKASSKVSPVFRGLGRWVWILAIGLLQVDWVTASVPPSTSSATQDVTTVILVVQGTVEVARSGSPTWEPAQTNQTLRTGDRLRTGSRSRATLRLSNRCVVPVNESTTLTIEPAAGPDKRTVLDLIKGSLFFQSRERPEAVQFRTRATSGAIRGTEFHLAADESGRTVLTLLDGEVELSNEQGRLTLAKGEQGTVDPGQPPRKTAAIDARNLIQWTLYYPGILDVDELELSAAEQEALSASLTAYRSGDLLQALARYPADRTPASDPERVYQAAVLLAVGQVAHAEECLGRMSNRADKPDDARLALRQMIAAVKQQTWEPRPGRAQQLAAEWMAESYYRQSRSDLKGALEAAKKAAAARPNFGFAWVRVAELEFGFGRVKAAREALDRGLQLSPRLAQGWAMKGYLLAAEGRIAAARQPFEQAVALDGNLGNGWLGLGLCKIRQGQAEAGRQDLQMAAALEPQRALLRSYLGKAFANEQDRRRARQELELAQQLDNRDPTAWLYLALLDQQENRLNEAVRDLETSKALNDNRRVYRSRLLLDQDQAVRSANLAGLYRDTGMPEIGLNEAARAVNSDYANASAHLFLADSYDALRDPRQINTRYETPWLNEYLVANLLAPAGGGVLSPNITQNEYGRLFQRNGVGLSSTTEYYSRGDFVERGAQFGAFGGVSYALETDYRSENGTRLNEDFRQLTFAAKVKLELTPQDSVYLQVIHYDAESGDVSQYYDPRNAQSWLRVKETQEPMLLAGYHHEWSPGVHTLLLAGRLQDKLEYNDPNQPELLLLRNAAGQVSRVPKPGLPVAPLDYESEFKAYTAELQQIWQQERHTLVAGGRYQIGDFDTRSRLGSSTPTRLGNNQSVLPFTFVSPPVAQSFSSDLQRISVYAYENVRLLEPLLLTAGVSYDRLTYPLNHRLAPISSSETTTDRWSPKAGLIWNAASNTTLRGSFTRSLGGVSYDQSFRLEPTQVAGFNQAYRNLISESLIGTAPAPTFETWGVALDQKCGRGTYFLVQAEWLNSEADRQIGTIDVGGPPTTYTTSQTLQQLDYRERNLSVGIHQLLGQDWSVGARYRLTDSELLTRFPAIAPTVTSAASTDQEATLHQVTLYAQYAHRCGFFGSFESLWSQQSNRGYSPDLPGDDFWQFNAFVGYRFPRRQAELKLGLLNLTGQDYRLNPLNFHPEYFRDRTLMLSCRLFF